VSSAQKVKSVVAYPYTAQGSTGARPVTNINHHSCPPILNDLPPPTYIPYGSFIPLPLLIRALEVYIFRAGIGETQGGRSSTSRGQGIQKQLSSLRTHLLLQLRRILCAKFLFIFGYFLANVNSRSRSLYAIARPSVCLSSVTLVRPTQAVQIFGNISTAFGTLAIH